MRFIYILYEKCSSYKMEDKGISKGECSIMKSKLIEIDTKMMQHVKYIYDLKE